MLELYFEQTYTFFEYSYQKLSINKSDLFRKHLDVWFKDLYGRFYRDTMKVHDISILHDTSRSGILFKEHELTGKNKKTRERLQDHSAKMASVFVLLMQEVYALKNKVSETTYLLLRIALNSSQQDLAALSTEDLEESLVFTSKINVNKAKLEDLKKAILKEHKLIMEKFPYDADKQKHYFMKSEGEADEEKICLDKFSIRLKISDSIIRKLFHRTFLPRNDSEQEVDITDYFGIKLVVKASKKETLIDYLAKEGVLATYERNSRLVRISTSIKKEIDALIGVSEDIKKSLNRKQREIWEEIITVLGYHFKNNPDTTENYSATTFKYLIPYGHKAKSKKIGAEILILDPEEEKYYDKSLQIYRASQIKTIMTEAFGLTDIFPKKKTRASKKTKFQKKPD